MTDERKDGATLTSDQMDQLNFQARILREWATSSWTPLTNSITESNFALFAQQEPEVFNLLKRMAELNFQDDTKRLEMREKFPEIWNWPIESEKLELMVYAYMGLGEEALKLKKQDYLDRIERTRKKNKTGLV